MNEPWMKLAFAAALEAKKLEKLKKLEELQKTKQDKKHPESPVAGNVSKTAITATSEGQSVIPVGSGIVGALGGAAIVGALGGATPRVLNFFFGEAEVIKTKNSKHKKSSDALQQLGDRIKSAREFRELTQDKCAELAGVSRTALRNLEEGGDTRLSTVFAVSHELSIPLTYLFQGLQPSLEEESGVLLSKK